jgi:hypothetical protein
MIGEKEEKRDRQTDRHYQKLGKRTDARRIGLDLILENWLKMASMAWMDGFGVWSLAKNGQFKMKV